MTKAMNCLGINRYELNINSTIKNKRGTPCQFTLSNINESDEFIVYKIAQYAIVMNIYIGRAT